MIDFEQWYCFIKTERINVTTVQIKMFQEFGESDIRGGLIAQMQFRNPEMMRKQATILIDTAAALEYYAEKLDGD